MSLPPQNGTSKIVTSELQRIECVTACLGFGDLLDETLTANHAHFDTLVVVTSHEDRETQNVCKKHGALVYQTDLFRKNERSFNKGAAINMGLSLFQYQGWRVHLDADIALPDSFRRMLFNHTHLDPECIYGADRVDIIGPKQWDRVKHRTQHTNNYSVSAGDSPISHRYVDGLNGYVPIGYFQLWHASCDKPYPWSKGTAAHDDVLFAAQWPRHKRQLLPSVICHHLCMEPPVVGENWDGKRKQPRWR